MDRVPIQLMSLRYTSEIVVEAKIMDEERRLDRSSMLDLKVSPNTIPLNAGSISTDCVLMINRCSFGFNYSLYS